MFNRSLQLFITIALVIAVSACDDTLSPKNYNQFAGYVQNIQVNPSEIDFNGPDAINQDTLVSLTIAIDAYDLEPDSLPFYYIYMDGNSTPILRGQLAYQSLNKYETVVQLSTTTTRFATYSILVLPYLTNPDANYSQTTINQIGIPQNAPVLLEVNNPESVTIPNDNSAVVALFTAKVTDADGQDNIASVFLNFRNQDGSLLSSTPFQLLDDGKNLNSDDSGDAVAADSVFTRRFGITSANTPNNRTAIYWAIDDSGLSSDTLETPFNIVAN